MSTKTMSRDWTTSVHINFASGREMPVYSTVRVQKALRQEFHYVFAAKTYPGIPRVTLHEINDEPFRIGEDEWTPLPVKHGDMPVLGFRLGGIAYITDANFSGSANMGSV